jgi:hypothetical protein
MLAYVAAQRHKPLVDATITDVRRPLAVRSLMMMLIVMMIVMIVTIFLILQKHRVIRDFVEHLRKSSTSDSTLTRVDLTHASVWNLDHIIRLRLVTCSASNTGNRSEFDGMCRHGVSVTRGRAACV